MTEIFGERRSLRRAGVGWRESVGEMGVAVDIGTLRGLALFTPVEEGVSKCQIFVLLSELESVKITLLVSLLLFIVSSTDPGTSPVISSTFSDSDLKPSATSFPF
jgi:hypothetical protein